MKHAGVIRKPAREPLARVFKHNLGDSPGIDPVWESSPNLDYSEGKASAFSFDRG